MHVFVDESERQDYLVCAVLVRGATDPLRTAVRGLCKPGQRRVHFSKEGPARRRAVLSALVELGVQARVYRSPRSVRRSREACLTAHDEPLLWPPDAIAWAVGRGGDWRRRVEPLLGKVIDLEP